MNVTLNYSEPINHSLHEPRGRCDTILFQTIIGLSSCHHEAYQSTDARYFVPYFPYLSLVCHTQYIPYEVYIDVYIHYTTLVYLQLLSSFCEK